MFYQFRKKKASFFGNTVSEFTEELEESKLQTYIDKLAKEEGIVSVEVKEGNEYKTVWKVE